MGIKREYYVCAISDGMRKILQVTKCTGIPCQMLFAEGLSKFVSKRFECHRY